MRDQRVTSCFDTHACHHTNNTADDCELVAEDIFNDQFVDMWPEYPCLYNVRSPNFKNWDLRGKAFQESSRTRLLYNPWVRFLKIDRLVHDLR